MKYSENNAPPDHPGPTPQGVGGLKCDIREAFINIDQVPPRKGWVD